MFEIENCWNERNEGGDDNEEKEDIAYLLDIWNMQNRVIFQNEDEHNRYEENNGKTHVTFKRETTLDKHSLQKARFIMSLQQEKQKKKR